MKFRALLLTLFISSFACGQTLDSAYRALAIKADSLFAAKKYKLAALTYYSAFKTTGNKAIANHWYKAAKAWNMAGNKDSAFYCLGRAARVSFFKNFDQDKIWNDSLLLSLHKDPRWIQFFEFINYRHKERSKASDSTATISLWNQSKKQVTLYWVNFENYPVFYGDLKAGEGRKQRTYLNHLWIVRNSNDLKIVKEFSIDSAYKNIIIK